MSKPLESKLIFKGKLRPVITQYLVDDVYVGIVQDGYGNLLDVEIIELEYEPGERFAEYMADD
jgi:hypothetical protein